MTEKKEEMLTIERFYKKSEELNEVYQNNMRETQRMFAEKQERLWNRLSEDDKKIVFEKERARLIEAQSKIVRPGLVDASGNKIGNA